MTESTTQGNERQGSQLGLEEIVHIANRVGLDYVEAKQKAEHLALLKPTTRARVMIRIEADQKISESRLLRLAEIDPEYVDFLHAMSEAKKEAERLKIRYESYKNLFEARRSMLSYQKAELKFL